MTELDVQRQTEAESAASRRRITRCRARPARTVEKATAAHFAIAALSDADGYAVLTLRELGADPTIVRRNIRSLE